MNLGYLLCLNHALAGGRYEASPFQLKPRQGWPFLTQPRPVSLEPVGPALAPAERAARRPPGGRAGKLEALALCLAVGLLAVAGAYCAWGAQHVAYARQKAALCRQLRQKELELRAVKEAYRALESRMAWRVAQEAQSQEFRPVVARAAAQKPSARS
jgi:hypothetical protein